MTQHLSERPARGIVIDPRIRQRRLEVRRHEGRRRLWFLVVVTVILALTGGAVGASRSPLLDVDRVEVRGTTRTPRPAVLAASGLARHPLMVDVDTRRVVREVELLPWVLGARARRAWPGTVVIDVTERTPAAVVRAGSGWAVVDVAGRVLEVTADRPPATPALVGGPPAGAPGTTLGAAAADPLRVVSALPPPLRERVGEVAAVQGGELVLQLVRPPGSEVRLGRPDNLELKLTSAATVLEKANLARLAALDVRVPSAPALTRR